MISSERSKNLSKNPWPSKVYNLGGGRGDKVAIVEADITIEEMTRQKPRRHYHDEGRKGDHMCYITNMRRFRSHYSNWELTRSLDAILRELIGAAR